ncbi:MAG: hypothetical protein HRT66_06225 [Flavobacteriaceae bacterium]|nr:hypothetical protein [Flavobacteriaceae bacterium]
MNKHIFILLILFSLLAKAQGGKIEILNADLNTKDQKKHPGASILRGNVKIRHNGAILYCSKAYLYAKKNYMKAMGKVIINQGDTIIQHSDYLDYDGNTLMAKSWGNVVLKDPEMELKTDTLNFDRGKQLLFYKQFATIKDSINVLTSDKGKYYLKIKKFQARTDVIITNPDYVLESEYLDYYTDRKVAYLYGPSTITSDESVTYCEKGFYDSKAKVSHLIKNAWVDYGDRILYADSLYTDQKIDFASGSYNVKMIDTVQNTVLKGDYLEVFNKQDSAYITKKAQVINLIENDSVYIHGDTIRVVGPEGKRIIKVFYHAKMFKSDMQAKADSIFIDESKGLINLLTRPVLWTEDKQISGDFIQLLSLDNSGKLDSIIIRNKAFILQKDSLGYNQVKGTDLDGTLENSKLKFVKINGNAESIAYLRSEDGELFGIDKAKSSYITYSFIDGQLDVIDYISNVDANVYPEDQFEDGDKLLKGFLPRFSERPMTKEDIFIHDDADSLIVNENLKPKNIEPKGKKKKRPNLNKFGGNKGDIDIDSMKNFKKEKRSLDRKRILEQKGEE